MVIVYTLSSERNDTAAPQDIVILNAKIEINNQFHGASVGEGAYVLYLCN